MIPIGDQQVLEDVTQGFVHLVAELTALRLEKRPFSIEHLKLAHVKRIEAGSKALMAERLFQIIESVAEAYKLGRTVRIDAPDSGALAICAGHTTHNFKWDALSNVASRPRNNVNSGWPPYHQSGVANDGGDRFNYAIEMQDNGQQGDVEILFTRDLASGPVKALILAAKQRGVIVYPFCFNALDENTEADLAQMTGHIMGRMLNVTLLVDQGVISPASFRKQLRNDLALLRQKDATRRKLRIAYG